MVTPNYRVPAMTASFVYGHPARLVKLALCHVFAVKGFAVQGCRAVEGFGSALVLPRQREP